MIRSEYLQICISQKVSYKKCAEKSKIYQQTKYAKNKTRKRTCSSASDLNLPICSLGTRNNAQYTRFSKQDAKAVSLPLHAQHTQPKLPNFRSYSRMVNYLRMSNRICWDKLGQWLHGLCVQPQGFNVGSVSQSSATKQSWSLKVKHNIFCLEALS